MENPKIRFKGFTKDWEQRKFADFTWDAGKRNKEDLDLEPYAITNEHGFIRQRDAHDDFGYMKDTDRKAYNIVQPNSFAYNPARINVGSIGYYKGVENVIVSSLYEVFQTDNYVNDRFLWHWLKSDEFPRWIEKLQEGSVRLYFYYDKLCECQLYMPSLEEQEKIASFLDGLDNLITLHQRKCEQTKKLKKYMLQKMFPRNGAKVPEIRFDGFTYDWEQRKLNEVAEKICVGFVGTCEKFYTDESGIPMYRTGNLNGLSLNRDDLKYVTNEFHQHNQKSQLKAGDILIARHGDSGKAVNYENSEEANCLNIVIIRPDFKKCNYKFLTNCINSPECQKHIKSLSAGSTQAVINTSEIEKLGVVIPANIDEQNRIARYFSTLDNLITLHQRKCDELKKMKKYMLQNMFI